MAAAEDVQEITIPSSDIEYSINYAIDIGGSRCKVAFRKKEAHSFKKDEATIIFATFSRDRIAEALTYIQQGLYYDESSGDVEQSGVIRELHATGISLRDERRTLIEEEMNVRITLIFESAGFFRAIQYLLRTKSLDEITYPFSEATRNKVERMRPMLVNFAKIIVAPASVLPEVANNGTGYPYLLIIFGSGIASSVILNEYESYIVDGSTFGGKTLMSLSILLLGISDYNELIDLAEKGDETKVSNVMSDFRSSQAADAYSPFPEDRPSFEFGKVLDGTHSSRREDIARTLLASFVRSFAGLNLWQAIAHGCKKVYIAGGGFERQLVRDEFYASFMTRAIFKHKEMEVYALRYASFLPVFGTLLSNAAAAKKSKMNASNPDKL